MQVFFSFSFRPTWRWTTGFLGCGTSGVIQHWETQTGRSLCHNGLRRVTSSGQKPLTGPNSFYAISWARSEGPTWHFVHILGTVVTGRSSHSFPLVYLDVRLIWPIGRAHACGAWWQTLLIPQFTVVCASFLLYLWWCFVNLTTRKMIGWPCAGIALSPCSATSNPTNILDWKAALFGGVRGGQCLFSSAFILSLGHIVFPHPPTLETVLTYLFCGFCCDELLAHWIKSLLEAKTSGEFCVAIPSDVAKKRGPHSANIFRVEVGTSTGQNCAVFK